MGAASISFVATNNASLQLRADPAMRGRVMSLNAIAFLGSTPIGAPLLGWISDVSNPRVALVLGGVATLLASIPLFALAARHRRSVPVEGPLDDSGPVELDGMAPVVPLPMTQVVDPLAERRTS
jgi:MFS family permease